MNGTSIMFKEIFLYELRYRFKKLSTWIYFGGVFLAAVLAILGAGGVLGNGNVQLGDASGKVHLNSPLTIYLLCGFMAYFGMMIVSAVMAGGIAQPIRTMPFQEQEQTAEEKHVGPASEAEGLFEEREPQCSREHC